MLTLGLETSGSAGSIALVEGGRLIESAELSPTGRRHARTLVSELKALLDRRGLRPADVACIAVSIGPGSFTGLRVGVVCAKTFAFAVGCPLVAVDTLQAVAEQSPPDALEVDVVLDALRGEFFYARYRREADRWRRAGDIVIAPAEQLSVATRGNVLLSGPGVAGLLAEREAPRIAPERLRLPAAESVARIGERCALTNACADLWSLEPLYIRRSAAEERADAARDGSVV